MLALKKFQPKSIISQPQNMKFSQLCSISRLVFSMGGLWYETILSREQVLTLVVNGRRVAMFGLVASVWEYHLDDKDSLMAKASVLLCIWHWWRVGHILWCLLDLWYTCDLEVYMDINDVEIGCVVAYGWVFVLGWKKPGISSRSIASDLVYCANMASG